MFHKIFSKINPIWVLRIFLGLVFVYSGQDLIQHPSNWAWALEEFPAFFQSFVKAVGGSKMYLQGQGILELIFAAILILPLFKKSFVKIVALLATFEMAGILFFVGINGETFRDIGLVGASFALFLLLMEREY